MSAAVAIPIISVFASVASTAVSAYSSYRAGEEEEKARKRAAMQARQRAEQLATAKEKEHRRLLATQRARYGAAGMTLEGTPLLVQMESMRESEEELERIKAGGEAYATEQERVGRQAARSGYVGAIGYGVGGVTTLSRIGRYYDWW